MLSSVRKCHQFACVERARIGVIVTSAALLAGCSADITRFDLGNPESARAHSENSYGTTSYGTTGRTASNEYGSAAPYDASRGSDVSRSDLPPPQGSLTTSAISPDQRPGYGQSSPGYGQPSRQPSYDQRSSGAPAYNNSGSRTPSYGAGGYGNSQNGASGYQNAPSGRVPPLASHDAGSHDSGAKGEMIEVRPGDTLYALSRRHKVSLNELMSLNGLSSPSLKPGQKLYLPAGTAGGTAVGSATQTARPERESYDTQHAAAAPSREAADAPADWTTSYTVRQGDSLYAIARQNGVKLADIERYNGISDSRKVKPGTVLKLPGHGAAAPVADASAATIAAPSASGSAPTPGAVQLGEVTNSPPQTSSSQQPTLLNGSNGDRVAKAETPGSANDAVAPTKAQNSGSVADSGRLRWPVAGKVISSFGPRPDGTHNDGVNLAAPMGTDVHAAETGVVAYAGDELKGYGNLVLVRHDNGWVTAYAHADEILVKRGDRIKRGQVIAKAGRTGQVDQPQVHFELRQGQKPVDPTPFMERL
jgi:murein DD-endopeptidase MepM/ murein hydrolase activator NlpD